MTRKGGTSVDRQNSEISYYADDEDGNQKKYSKRGKQVIDCHFLNGNKCLFLSFHLNIL
jgi:hypothetical protein